MKFNERPAVILLFDIAASAAVAVGVAWALATIFHVSSFVTAGAAGIVFVRIFSSLRKHAPAPFRLPQFEVPALEFEPEELLLDDVLAAYDGDSRVVAIFAGADPGDLRNRIERHLHAPAAQQEQVRSASEELAEALAELRRSIRSA